MMRVWLDGKVSEGPITFNAADRGLTLGDGLFETLLVLNGVALWRADHVARMKAAASELGISFPEDRISRAIVDLCADVKSAHVLRLTLTRGVGARGLAAEADAPTFFATLVPFDAALIFRPVQCCVVSVRRNADAPSSRMKTLSCVDQIVAAREAEAEGFEEGIMCNTAGFVACGTIGNVFLLKGRTLLAPALDQGVLPGIMRGVVLEGASGLGFAVEERKVELHELSSADGVFLTNSLRLLRPALGYACTAFPEIVELICAGIRAQCGVDPRL